MKKPLMVIALALVAVAFAVAPQYAQDKKPAAANVDFAGKVLSIRVKGDQSTGYFLADAKLMEVGSRRFLVGMGPSEKLDLRNRTGIAWDDVVAFIEMTPGEYETYKKGVLENVAKDEQPQ